MKTHRPPSISAAAASLFAIEPLEARIAPAVFVVNVLTDNADDVAGTVNGTLSLREAIIAANANAAFGDAAAGDADGDQIVFDPALAGGTLTLGNGEFTITDDLQIFGRDAANGTVLGLTIDAAQASRIFSIDADDLVSGVQSYACQWTRGPGIEWRRGPHQQRGNRGLRRCHLRQ